MQRLPTRQKSTASWWSRGVMWAVFAVTLVASMQLSGQAFFADPTATDTALVVQARTPAPTGPLMLANTPTGPCGTRDCSRLLNATSDQMDLVPAWRWRDDTDLFASYGTFDLADKAGTSLAEMLFGIAGVMWFFVLGALRLALGFDLLAVVGSSGDFVNKTFKTLSDSLVSSGLVVMVIIGALFFAIKAVLKGDIAGAVSTVVAALIPIAVLFAMTNASAETASVDTVGSPAYFASKGLTLVDGVAGGIGEALSDQRASLTTGAGDYEKLSPSCVAYNDALLSAFRQGTQQVTPQSSSTSGDEARTKRERAFAALSKESLLTVSALWERAYVSNWLIAQYNGAQPGGRIWCHHFEANANTPRAVQAEIGYIAGYPSYDTPDAKDIADGSDLADDVRDCHYGGAQNSVFGPGSMLLTDDGRQKSIDYDCGDGPDYYPNRSGRRDPYVATTTESRMEFQASLLMWAACINTGGNADNPGTWNAQAAWNATGKLEARHCQQWWHLGTGPDFGKGGSSEKLAWGSKIGQAGTVEGVAMGDGIVNFQSGLHDDVSDVAGVVYGFTGDNSSGRVLSGFTAVVTGGVFLYVLGGIAVGTLVAKIGFLVMLLLLPVTLFLLAMPTGSRRRHPGGVKLLKMTGGYLAANAVLTGFIVLLITVIDALTGLTVNAIPFGGGTNGLVTMAVPLIALFVLRKALKAVGMGDVASARGSVGMAATAAAGAGGGGTKAMHDRQRSALDKDGNPKSRTGRMLDRFDKAAKVPQNRAKAWGKDRAKGAAATAGAVAGAAGGFAKSGADKALQGVTNHGLDDWKDKMTGPGSLPQKLTTAAGIGALVAAATQNGRLEGFGKTAHGAARAITGLNPKLLEKADVNQNALDEKRGRWTATAGKTGVDRDTALNAYAADRRQAAAALQANRALFGDEALGTPVTDAAGNTVTGFSVTGPNGTRRFLSAAEAGFDAATGTAMEGVQIHTATDNPLSDLDSPERKLLAGAYADRYGLPLTSVGVGTDVPMPMYLPDAGSVRPPGNVGTDALIDIGRQGAMFTPLEFRQRIATLDPAAQAQAYVDYGIAGGWIDVETGAVDAFAAFGMDADSATTAVEMEKWSKGEKSAFDGRTIAISSAAVSQIVASAHQQHDAVRQADVTYQAREAVGEVLTASTRASRTNVSRVQEAQQTLAQWPAKVEKLNVLESEVSVIDEQLALKQLEAASAQTVAARSSVDAEVAQLSSAREKKAAAAQTLKVQVEHDATTVLYSDRTMDEIESAVADVAMIPVLREIEVSDSSITDRASIEALAKNRIKADLQDVKAKLESIRSDAALSETEQAAKMSELLDSVVREMTEISSATPTYYEHGGAKKKRSSSHTSSNPFPG
jgi:hypothetical protein